MAFQHRKLLDDDDDDDDDDDKPEIPRRCRDFRSELCPPDCIDFCSTVSEKGHKDSKVPLLLTVFSVILITTVFFIVCYILFKFCFNRYRPRRIPMNEEEPVNEEFVNIDEEPVLDNPIWYIRTVGLQPSVISSITVFSYKKDDHLIEGTACSICLSRFREHESLRLLPKCNHAFHTNCIDTWLRSHTNCPMCRAGIVKNNPVSTREPVVSVDEISHSSVSERNREAGRESETESSSHRIEDGNNIGLKVSD